MTRVKEWLGYVIGVRYAVLLLLTSAIRPTEVYYPRLSSGTTQLKGTPHIKASPTREILRLLNFHRWDARYGADTH